MEKQPQLKFLPHYFKLIGGGIILLGITLIITRLVFGQYNMVRPNIALWIIYFGFMLFAFAKGKIEDKKLMEKKVQPGLPNYFKKIGIGIVLFAIIVFIPFIKWFKKFSPEDFENYQVIFKIIFKDVIYIGFLLFALAKEKVEDELIVKIRLQSLASAFIFGIVWVITKPIFHYMLQNEIEDLHSQDVIMPMLIVYIILFHFSKKNR